MSIKQARKAAVAVVTALSTAVAYNLVPTDKVGWAVVTINTLGALGVYAVKNERIV